MTFEEAIKVLKDRECCHECVHTAFGIDGCEDGCDECDLAFDMAFSALTIMQKESEQPIYSSGCARCRYFSGLSVPRKLEEGVMIYGYCFKHGGKNHNFGKGKGFPVYLADGRCKDFSWDPPIPECIKLAIKEEIDKNGFLHRRKNSTEVEIENEIYRHKW